MLDPRRDARHQQRPATPFLPRPRPPQPTMPRRQRSAPAPSKPVNTAPQSRPASTSVPAPVPAAAPPVPYQQSSGPGLFGQMASTAAGVAVGHTIGHGLSNALFGGSSHHAVEAAPVQAQAAPAQGFAVDPCAADNQRFVECLQKSSNDISACQVYLDLLKQCSARVAENARYAA
ncbi:hypothetical protein DFJ74DRAFT_689029 [Hyaloraphidium curvatum]|nr:hypothetical protein DFJ74DRAFT_689029 [Hyaloraphidium curvatum]